jgi:hypothetical protein
MADMTIDPREGVTREQAGHLAEQTLATFAPGELSLGQVAWEAWQDWRDAYYSDNPRGREAWQDVPEKFRAAYDQIGAAVEAAARERALAALDACLPEGADRPLTPELVTALLALHDVARELGTAESGVLGYQLIAHEDVGGLDEASGTVEDLLHPPTTDEEEARRG